MLTIIESHPIQYHAPVYRVLQSRMNIPVTVIYGSDFSVIGYKDREFGAEFAWDTDLLSGYKSIFLARVAEGGARSTAELSSRGLRETLNKLRPKVVMLGGYSACFDRTAFWQTLKRGHSILFRGETTDHAQKRNLLKSNVRDLVLRRLYRKCAKLLYIGQRSYQHYRRLDCQDDKLVFSPYCVDTSPFKIGESARTSLRSVIRRHLGVSDEKIVLIMSGKLSYRKGPDLLLQALKELPAEKRNKFVVCFLGSGQLQRDLEQLANTSPNVNVIFLGFKNQHELSPYYHGADLLVLASRYSETWGLVINDALHHGLPCVVSDMVGCGPDLIVPGQTGEIFYNNSAQSLGEAVQRASLLIGRQDVRDRCLNVIEGYSVDMAAEGIAKAYHSIRNDVTRK